MDRLRREYHRAIRKVAAINRRSAPKRALAQPTQFREVLKGEGVE